MTATELIQAYYAAFNAGDMPAFLDLLAEDVVHDINQGERQVGKATFAAFMDKMNRCYRERLADIVVMQNADGSRAAAEFTVHGQYVADERTLAQLEDEGRVVFRYAAGATHGPAGFEQNPNGSRHDIAGVTNAAGNVVGLMPHPEHATEAGFGPLSLGPDGASHHGGTDGLGIFHSVLASLVG